MTLDLSFTAEQDMLRETVRGVCAQHAPLPVVRQLEDDAVGYPPELWKQLAALDLCGLLIPGEFGGSGRCPGEHGSGRCPGVQGSDMSMLDAAVVYEEFGRSLAPTPHFVSCVLSAGALTAGDAVDLQREWLPQVAAGTAILTPAWLEPDCGFGPLGVRLRADGDGDAFVLKGVKRHAQFASSATRLVVLARTGAGATDVGLFLVDPAADGVTITQQHSVGSDTQYRVELDGVRVPAADRVGGWPAWEAAMYDGAILAAAQAAGGAAAAQSLAVQYAKDREQFGKPLGAFQAIAHYLADRQTELDGATTLVHEAAWARSVGRSVSRLAPMAKLFACRTYRSVTATAQQIFGGNGFTVEFDIQLYFRRAKLLQLSWWDDRHLEQLIADDVLN